MKSLLVFVAFCFFVLLLVCKKQEIEWLEPAVGLCAFVQFTGKGLPQSLRRSFSRSVKALRYTHFVPVLCLLRHTTYDA